MALIENTVGELPYLLTDFDQHSYESEDCFTRFMPKAKLDTAVRPIVAPSGRKVLLANDRIVTALENDLDQAYVPGSLVEMLKQRSSGNESDAERFFEPMQPEYLDRDARLKQLTEQQIETLRHEVHKERTAIQTRHGSTGLFVPLVSSWFPP